MKRLIGSAVLLSLVFSSDYPLLVTTTAFAAGKVSSSYSYLKGAGKVDYKTFEDTSRGIVIHDFNGDGYVDLIATNSSGAVVVSESRTEMLRGPIFLWLNGGTPCRGRGSTGRRIDRGWDSGCAHRSQDIEYGCQTNFAD